MDNLNNCGVDRNHRVEGIPEHCPLPDKSELEIIGKELGIENCTVENIVAKIKRIKAFPNELERWVKYFQEQWRKQDNIYKNYVSYDSLLDKIQELKEGKDK